MALKKKANTHVNILGLCLQSSSVKGKPHEIIGTLYIENDSAKIENCKCSCVAGLAVCKMDTIALLPLREWHPNTHQFVLYTFLVLILLNCAKQL